MSIIYMEYLGRVITNGRKINTIDFVDKTSKYDSIDTSIPTLIIGKALAEKIYGKDKIHILTKKIEDNVFWTYSKTEKRNEFEADMEKFNAYIIKNMRSRLKYTYFSVLTNPFSKVKSLIKYISDKNIKKVIYIYNKHLYIYSGKNLVLGLSLVETEYIGLNSEKIVTKIKKNPNNIIIENDYFLSYSMKIRLDDDFVVIPYLYSLEKGYFSN